MWCVVSVVPDAVLCCVVLYPTDYLNVCVVIRRRKLTLLKRREGSLRRHCPQGMLFIRLCESTNPGCQKFSKRRAAKRREERREMWKNAFLSLLCRLFAAKENLWDQVRINTNQNLNYLPHQLTRKQEDVRSVCTGRTQALTGTVVSLYLPRNYLLFNFF